MRQVISDLLDDLPPESRRFAGHDEASMEAFVAELLREGTEDIAARMKAEERQFTDQAIDFGDAADGPDLHIIYGLNEAGKSTTFSAYLDLLFGMGDQNRYNFKHDYSAMQIGAVLEFGGEAHRLVRIKKRVNSLVDAAGEPVNEAVLAAALGGIGRDAYRTMFSLDDQSLKDGGNAIMQSRGELGELLFSASSGLAGLSQ
eukprot:gene66156-90550_t